MKHFITFFTVLLMIAGNQIKGQDTDKNAPVAEFDKKVHNYGTIERGSDGTCEFTFKNTGKEPLVLSNVRSSCGCTTPNWTREPVKKGDEGTIKVRYNTRIVGSFNKSITIYSNASNNPVRLSIRGKVVKEKDETSAKSE